MNPALRVESVSKQYRIYNRPGDRLTESLTRGRLRRHREFWALRDVSFQIEAGTSVGIIGPNGCGKSTLLQIICGTLAPTQGEVWHEGRVAALLELGAGFDLEFTGVENVLMNASLMGFSRRETENILPSIERFAEIGQFFYQPVKTYSSGMYVRLAFAIAASVEPDILVIDEALAVGDAVFQHRCLRRIKELQERGATVLFVSHDTAAVRALCDRAILFTAGRMIADGEPAEILNRYQKIVMEREEAYEADSVASQETEQSKIDPPQPLHYTYRHGDGSAEIIAVELSDPRGRRKEIVETGSPLVARVTVRFARDLDQPVIGFLIRNRHGIHAYGTNTKEQQVELGAVRRGQTATLSFSFDCSLGVDDYSVSFAVHSRDGQAYDWLDGTLFFKVTSPTITEGVANLNAQVQIESLSDGAEVAGQREEQSLTYG
jgi:ABC-type polysaccharide/polyol phosphate transport system ATPase subunit